VKKKNKAKNTEHTIEISVPNKPASPGDIAEHGAVIADLLLYLSPSEADRACAVAFSIAGDSQSAAYFANREQDRNEDESDGKDAEPGSYLKSVAHKAANVIRDGLR
jgi:hypothetical protein